jgi:rare lipoprotein A
MRRGKSASSWGLSLLLSLLVACGGQPSRPLEVAGRDAASAQTPAKTARKSSVVQKRGGAYYKDDGPADEIPDNLDDIADAQPRLEPLHRFANRPYVVLGKAYEPDTSLRSHQQRGVASWYGKKFHGQKTSIGEPYDMFSMTAAHPTLAIPSYARVTRVSNGRSVVVRVIDRGPFHADRVIDLSYAAAYRLGYVDQGSTEVEVESILPEGATTMTYAQVATAPRPAAAGVNSPGRDEIELLAARLGLDQAGAHCSRQPQPRRLGHHHGRRRLPAAWCFRQCRQCRKLALASAARTRLAERGNPDRRWWRHAPCPSRSLSKPCRRRKGRRADSSRPGLPADLRRALIRGFRLRLRRPEYPMDDDLATFVKLDHLAADLDRNQPAVVGEHFAAHGVAVVGAGDLAQEVSCLLLLSAGIEIALQNAEQLLQGPSEQSFCLGVGGEDMSGLRVGDQDASRAPLKRACRRLLASRSSSSRESS